MYQKLGVGWMFSLLAFIALAFVPVPWVFYRYGEKWRARERYGGRSEDAAGKEEVGARAEGREISLGEYEVAHSVFSAIEFWRNCIAVFGVDLGCGPFLRGIHLEPSLSVSCCCLDYMR
jgi:hypothetical protein